MRSTCSSLIISTSLTHSKDEISDYFQGFPAMLICRRIGAGLILIIGGVLSCVGMTCTAFSQAAWQALLANGFLTGEILPWLSTYCAV